MPTKHCFMNTTLISQKLPRREAKSARVPATICKARPTSKMFTEDQLAFLSRKASGTMPNGCESCDGIGMQTCCRCQGLGQNGAGLAEKLFDLKNVGVHQRAPDININYMFMEGMPCFICKGSGTSPCGACDGTGMAHFATNFTPSD